MASLKICFEKIALTLKVLYPAENKQHKPGCSVVLAGLTLV